MKRRKFLQRTAIAGAGLFIAPGLLRGNDTAADTLIHTENRVEPLSWSPETVSMAWVGHSTILINLFGKWILTDPVFTNRVGVTIMGVTFGPSRLTTPALDISQVPKPDIILLSHGHMDHTDYPTLSMFAKQYPGEIDLINAYLTSDITEDLPWKSVTTIDWNEQKKVQGITFTGLEVDHFGWRVPWEKDRSRGYFKDGRSYNAYLIESDGASLLFGGDTALTDKFKVIGDRRVDVAMMPIGAYNPWRKVHCSPEEALQMADDVNAEYFTPMHCMTFKQGEEGFMDPVNRLKKYSGQYKTKVMWDEIGSSLIL